MVELLKSMYHTTSPQTYGMQFPQQKKRRINDERRQYRDNKRQRISEVGYVPPAINVQNDEASLVDGSTIGPVGVNSVATNSDTNTNEFQGSIMGGRYEQASLRSRNTNSLN